MNTKPTPPPEVLGSPSCSAFFACDSVTGRGQTNTWFTPKELVDALGPFDLDPCTQTFRPHDTAARHICEDAGECGMASKWEGRVWLNPPYGKEIAKWLGKLADHGNGIALVFARTDTAWAQSILKRVDAANFMKGRVAFIPVGEKKPTANSSGTPSMLLAFGRENAEAIKRLPGVILLPNAALHHTDEVGCVARTGSPAKREGQSAATHDEGPHSPAKRENRQNPAMTARPNAPTSPMTANGQALAAMPCCALRVLRLTLKRKWFDMIASGEKREEYRTPGKWILSRLESKEYDRIEFKNGYGPNVPTMEVEYLGWAYSFGKRQWGGGGEQGKPYATIYLGRVLSLHNAALHHTDEVGCVARTGSPAKREGQSAATHDEGPHSPAKRENDEMRDAKGEPKP